MIEKKTKEWHERRRAGIGGSDATTLMSGDAERILALWEIKTGKREPEDLDDVFEVALGTYTEAFNRWWFAKTTFLPVVAAGEFRQSLTRPWMVANLDGEVVLDNHASAVFEAKHVGSRNTMASVVERYQPQLHHNMIVCGFQRAYLSVIIGNTYDWVQVDYNREYAEKLIEVEAEFWECVRLGMPPSERAEPVAPPPATRVIDMTGSNEWAAAASDWMANEQASKTFDAAAKSLRELVPADARSCAGHGIRIDRDKRRALRIRRGDHAE